MLRSITDCLLIAGLALSLCSPRPAMAQDSEPRLALVIGNAQYADPLATAANDAGLIADSLRTAGFDVIGAANLDQDALRRAFRDFLDKAAQAGPNAIVFVYLSGLGLQYEGENYFAPIGAVIARDSDIPLEAVRLSDFTHALAALPLRGRIMVLDAARANNFAKGGQLAGGLALVNPDPGAIYAFNAAPGTIAPNEPGPYGAYAQALAEMLREGGVSLEEAFSQVRLRVDQITRGAFTPWDASTMAPPIVLLERPPNAPRPDAVQSYAALESRPIGSFSPAEAYAAALQRDTLDGYQDFLVAFPNAPLARRVRALLAARREALTWRRTVSADTPDAYWSYMERYPHGPHVFDARRRLTSLTAPLEPPPRFDSYDFGGLPPPPEVEYEIVDRPVVVFYSNDYPPPPPPPIYFLPPAPLEFVRLPPPPPPQHPGFLPIPIPIPLTFAHPTNRPGVFNQPNFGQQGPVGAGPGGRNPPPAGASPGAVGQPNHNLPSGNGSPSVASPAAQPSPAAPGAGQPNHNLPSGNGSPSVASPAAQPSPAAPGAGQPNHNRPPSNSPPGAAPALHSGAPVAPLTAAPAVPVVPKPAGAFPGAAGAPANGAVIPPHGNGLPAASPQNQHPNLRPGGAPAGNSRPGDASPIPGNAAAPKAATAPAGAIQRTAPPAAAVQSQPKSIVPQSARPSATPARPKPAPTAPPQVQQMRPSPRQAPPQQMRPQIQQQQQQQKPQQQQQQQQKPQQTRPQQGAPQAKPVHPKPGEEPRQ
jgi:uncharacterized caspase-like protein